MSRLDTSSNVSIIELPDDNFFIFIDGIGEGSRVMINTGDIKEVIFPQGDDLVLKINSWNDVFVFTGRDASDLEEFFLSRRII